MDPQTVADDEARRIAQHELVKKSVAAGLKQKATAEVAETEGELQRARRTTRLAQVGEYVFF